MSGADILKTLIELLEAQENIKITYEIKETEVVNERFTRDTEFTQKMA